MVFMGVGKVLREMLKLWWCSVIEHLPERKPPLRSWGSCSVSGGFHSRRVGENHPNRHPCTFNSHNAVVLEIRAAELLTRPGTFPWSA